MKKILIITTTIIAIVLLGKSSPTYSQAAPSPTPATKPDPTVAKEEVTDKIQELKDKVASRVAALKKDTLTGASGTVKSATDEAIIFISGGNEYSVQLDEEAVVYEINDQLKKKEIKMSTLQKDSPVTIIGSINKEELTAVAYRVVAQKTPQLITGTVKEVSTKDGTITLNKTGGGDQLVDIEVSSQVRTANTATQKIAKIGLSRIEANSNIIVYGIPGEDNKITAHRVLVVISGEIPSPTSTKSTPTVAPKPTANE